MPISERTRLGLAIEKAGCRISASTRSTDCGPGNARLDLEPFVEHQRIGAVALLEGGERLRRPRACPACRCARIVSAAERSVMLVAAQNCCAARAGSPRAGAEIVEQHVAQRPAPGARRVGAERVVAAEPAEQPLEQRRIGVGDRLGERLARGKDRVGIDVGAELAGDVGLARQRQRQRPEGRLERLVGGDRAGQPGELVREFRLPCRRGIWREATISASVSSELNACQRENGSLSWRARKARSSCVCSMLTA